MSAREEVCSLCSRLYGAIRDESLEQDVRGVFGSTLEEGEAVEAVRDALLLRLLARVREDLDALLPHLIQRSEAAAIVRLVLVLRLGKAYIALRQASAACVGGERGRGLQHAFDDAGAALMAHVTEAGA